MSLECKRQQVISGNEVKTGLSSWSCPGAGWHPQPGTREIWDFTVPLMKKCSTANPRGLEGRAGPKRFSLSNKHNSAAEMKPIQSMDREGFLLKIRVKYGIMGGALKKKKTTNRTKMCFQQKRKLRMVNSQGPALSAHLTKYSQNLFLKQAFGIASRNPKHCSQGQWEDVIQRDIKLLCYRTFVLSRCRTAQAPFYSQKFPYNQLTLGRNPSAPTSDFKRRKEN